MPEPEPSFLASLRARARARPRAVLFPEGEEARIQEAARAALEGALYVPVLLGDPDTVRAGLRAAGVTEGSISVVDPVRDALLGAPGTVLVVDSGSPGLMARASAALTRLREARGGSTEGVEALGRDPLSQAAVLVREGAAAGAVAGSVRTTADVVRSALGGIGLAPGRTTLSSAFYMVFEPGHPIGPRVLTFTDAGVVPQPDPVQLAEIAASAAAAHAEVVGEEPRVAFLSYSTLGSAEGPSVDRSRQALARFREIAPAVSADGELQGDAALVPAVARAKAPGSDVAGRANVLVFPDLASANVAYKLVQHLGGAHALGPVLQGLARPFNDLSRGASASDVVSVACITALMAGEA